MAPVSDRKGFATKLTGRQLRSIVPSRPPRSSISKREPSVSATPSANGSSSVASSRCSGLSSRARQRSAGSRRPRRRSLAEPASAASGVRTPSPGRSDRRAGFAWARAGPARSYLHDEVPERLRPRLVGNAEILITTPVQNRCTLTMYLQRQVSEESCLADTRLSAYQRQAQGSLSRLRPHLYQPLTLRSASHVAGRLQLT